MRKRLISFLTALAVLCCALAPASAQTLPTTGDRNMETEHGYYLYKIPLLVDLSEDDFNIVYAGMDEHSKSVERCPYSFAQIRLLLTLGYPPEMLIWRIGENGLARQAARIDIRIKEKKFEGLPESVVLASVVPAMARNGAYQMETVHGIRYAVFEYIAAENEIRYAAVMDGRMVYICLSSPEPLTQADYGMLNTVLNHISIVK